ncbi:MAG TPA: vWA domain-containing protein, partial [Acidothermaceae bacterium]|nr:vWA domain-containing protein [Acidothermaceae bacterium]
MPDETATAMRLRRIAATIAAAVLGLGALTALATAASAADPSAPPSSASSSAAPGAPTGRIVQLTTNPGSVQVLFSAVGLGEGQSIDPKSVQLSADGESLPVTATAVGSKPPPQVMRSAMLVVDISGSMKGAGIDGAKAAANAFLAAVPADVRVGLVTVSTTAVLAVAPTTNRTLVRNQVAALQATGNTALYDGTLLALQTLGNSGSLTVVLLTDGHDEGSKATLA